MIAKKDWPKLIALAIFFTLLGGYYERLPVETRTFIIPLLIFVAAAFVLGRLKQLQYEIRSSRVTTLEIVAQQLSLADVEMEIMKRALLWSCLIANRYSN
jgi:hypothetical protein